MRLGIDSAKTAIALKVQHRTSTLAIRLHCLLDWSVLRTTYSLLTGNQKLCNEKNTSCNYLMTEVEVIFMFLFHQHEVFVASKETVDVMVSVIMDDRPGSSRAHPEVCLVNVIQKCPTQQTLRHLGKRRSQEWEFSTRCNCWATVICISAIATFSPVIAFSPVSWGRLCWFLSLVKRTRK